MTIVFLEKVYLGVQSLSLYKQALIMCVCQTGLYAKVF